MLMFPGCLGRKHTRPPGGAGAEMLSFRWAASQAPDGWGHPCRELCSEPPAHSEVAQAWRTHTPSWGCQPRGRDSHPHKQQTKPEETRRLRQQMIQGEAGGGPGGVWAGQEL